MRKVLHLIKSFELGGAEKNLLNLLSAFDHQRFKHIVAYSFGGVFEQDFRQCQHVEVFQYNHKRHKIGSWQTIVSIVRLFRFLIKNDIDIIHTHNFSAHFIGMIAGKLAGKKIVEHVHDCRYYEIDELKKRQATTNHNFLSRWTKGMSNRVLVLTERNYEFLLKHQFYSKEKIHLIENGIPISSQIFSGSDAQQIENQFQLNPDHIVLLCAGRMDRSKNFGLLIRILPVIIQSFPQVVLILAGEGPLFQEYEQEIKRLGLSTHVRLIGFYPDMLKLLNRTQIFVLPSMLELNSMVIMEAMSMKVPVVISQDVGNHNAMIKNGVNGMLCDPFVESSWQKAIVQLLTDSVLRKQMGLNGFETVCQHFSLDQSVKKIEAVYQALI